jgi:hypothetical protein
MHVTDKKSKELRSINFDNNYNYNFEMVDTYTKGKLTSKAYDSDEDGNFEETCSYANFVDAVRDGKWGGWVEWEHLFEESEY